VEVEARLLLYTVALGGATGLAHLAWRRASEFRAYAAELALLLAASIAALLVPSWTRHAAWPLFWAFAAVAAAPPLLIEAARRASGARRYGIAWASSSVAAALLGMPAPLRREAAVYGALAAAERGDEATCRRRLERTSRAVGIPHELGGDTLVLVLPAAARRAWRDVLAALVDGARRPPALLALEVRAAAETGDLRRALRACREIDAFGHSADAVRATARRNLLAAAGRADFLADAVRLGLPLVDGAPGTAESSVARAREARGDVVAAAAGYDAARRLARGAARVDAAAGAARCRGGRPIVAVVDEASESGLRQLEAACAAEPPQAPRTGVARRAPFTLAAVSVTAAASALVFVALGFDSISLVAAGALSAPLISFEHEWWRLGATMLLHGGWFHLAMNLVTIVFVGVPLESRIGAARTTVVYLGAGFLASAASAFGNDTQLGVGASGAAMGLIGALGVVLLRRPALFADADRRRWLLALGVSVAATAAIGAAERESIDNVAHGVGLAAGAGIGLLMLRLDGAARTSVRRACAAALAAAMAACVVATAAHHADWRGEKVVETSGARATLPVWMRTRRTADAGIVAWRAPLDLAVQLGAEPERPRPELLAPETESMRRDFDRLLAAGPTRREEESDAAGATRTFTDYAEPSGKGFRVCEFRRGPAFLVAVVWTVEGGESEDSALAARIGRSLAAVE
jgi:membrane associated rhomboid family serine protease